MKWKEFLNPTIKKVIFTIVLLLLSLLYMWRISDFELRGLPLGYLGRGGFGFIGPWHIDYGSLVVDIIFWYLVSCLISWIYKKVKK